MKPIYSKEQLAKIEKAKKIVAERNKIEIQKAAEFAKSNPTNPKVPKNIGEALARSVIAGITGTGATASNMVQTIPGLGQLKVINDLSQGLENIANEQSSLVDNYSPDVDNPVGYIAAQSLARFPKTFASIAQDVYSPVSKVKAGATLASKYPQIASLVEKYGPTAVNAAYHAVRGYANNGKEGAIVTTTGNLVGEKIIEPTVLKMLLARFPEAQAAANVAFGSGNIGGMAVENAYDYLKNK